MANDGVGLGQLVTTTGYHRSRVLKDAVSDNLPLYQMMDKAGGIKRIDGGLQIVEEAKTTQNSTVSWVGESGQVSLADTKVLDAAAFPWAYMLGSVSWTLAERYKNSGGSDTKFIDVVAGKFEVLEESMMNLFHEGMLSLGTSYSGLQMVGLAALVSTTPTSGTTGGVDKSLAASAWYRTQKFDTVNDWSNGTIDAGNVKLAYDKAINATTRNSIKQVQAAFAGQTHFEALTAATQAIQIIQNESGTANVGFDKIVYRGVPVFFGNGVNYSGLSSANTGRTYFLCLKPGGVNLYFHEKAEFAMLEPFNSQDQAAISRLMFTMAAMTIGGLAKLCDVVFDS